MRAATASARAKRRGRPFRATRGPAGGEHWPRAINFVTGPSRSGDIEQKLVLGAHGPRALHLIVVGE